MNERLFRRNRPKDGTAAAAFSAQTEFTFSAAPNRLIGRDSELEALARQLFESLGQFSLREKVRVAWSPRLRSAAGRADTGRALVLLNPLLRDQGAAEIDRTLRHELAHLLAHARAGRRRIEPHGAEWRSACEDLGIGGEARCHTLPFPVRRRERPFLYRCPACGADFPRTRPLCRAVACLACCRRHHHGKFDGRFRLRLVKSPK